MHIDDSYVHFSTFEISVQTFQKAWHLFSSEFDSSTFAFVLNLKQRSVVNGFNAGFWCNFVLQIVHKIVRQETLLFVFDLSYVTGLVLWVQNEAGFMMWYFCLHFIP